MWPFKKKLEKEKVYCSECKHYKYYNGNLFNNKHECYANYDKQEKVTISDSPISRSYTFSKKRTVEDAWDKNYHNDCEDYQPLVGENK